jgi:hypothetical protein
MPAPLVAWRWPGRRAGQCPIAGLGAQRRPVPVTALGNGLRYPLQVIGVVCTAHSELAATPIQAGLNRAEQGTIEIDARYREGLDGRAGFGYAGC